MKIAIDARLLERRITGIGRSLMLLLNEIPKIDTKNEYYLFTYETINHDKNFYKNIPTIKNFLPQKIFSPIWSNFILPFYLRKNKIDLLFSVNQIVPLIKIRPCKYISVVHDVIYKADPNFLPYIYRKYLQIFAYFSIRISDIIITISVFSKKDILKHYKINSDKVKVILQSANSDFIKLDLTEDEKNEIKKINRLAKKNVLYVGMIENRKNIFGILKVADKVKEVNKDVGFILVGKFGYGSEKIIYEINKRENVTHLSNVDDELLKKLYNISNVFLFPSFYEGFGYPPLEAMQCGLPVIASDNTSLSEVVGAGGLLHNPNDYEGMTEDILKLLSDDQFYNKISQQGIEQAKKFNLEKTAQQIVNIFNSLDAENKKK
ncbi:MAG: glycosyltransferase family 4 protein [Ignavibacteriales bacterium]|nr:glycosyltransferase family 4 protein [Ignavibacteriales bacterium]